MGCCTFPCTNTCPSLQKTICAYLSGDQENSGTFIAIYNRSNETVTSWYHKGFIFPPDKHCILLWHNGSDHFNWIKQKDTIVRPNDNLKKQSRLTFGQTPISTTNKQSIRSKDETVIHSNKKRKIIVPKYIQSDNELTVVRTTKKTEKEIDEQMVESESSIETYQIKLKNI